VVNGGLNTCVLLTYNTGFPEPNFRGTGVQFLARPSDRDPGYHLFIPVAEGSGTRRPGL